MIETPRASRRAAELSHIGAALKEERLIFGITQKQAAKQFGISLKALRNLEQGSDAVSLSTVRQILKYFGKELRVGDIILAPAQHNKKRPRLKTVLETLQMLKPILEKKFNVESMALFGSCAKDQATKNSDIDLAVKYKKPPTFSTLGRMTVFLETLLDGHKVDLVEMDKMIPEVATTARKEFIYV